jgi:hypothetical protein
VSLKKIAPLPEIETLIMKVEVIGQIGFAVAQVVSLQFCRAPGQVMWNLWWTKWLWGRFNSSISVSPANSHYTDCSVFIYHSGLV